MSTFVIVHGGFGGAWEWTPVAGRLRARGHELFTPTLTGMGERTHLAGPGVDLRTHVEDVVAAIEMEDLRDIVLCAHSYGGMPVSAAADRVAERIRLLIYIDALVPMSGQSALDLLPEWFGAEARETADARGLVPMPPSIEPPGGWIPEEERVRYVRRLRGQPLRSLTEPIGLSGAGAGLPTAFVRCTHAVPPGDPISPIAARVRARGWRYREIKCPHDPQILAPDRITDVLDELAAGDADPDT